MLRQYETVRAFLARDDLRSARRAVQAYQKGKEAATPGSKTPVTDAVAKIAGANSLDPAREGFRAWSVYVIQLTRDVTGFYVIHCPLPGCGDWLQTDPKVDNPFMGKAMPDCGEVEK